MLESLNGKQEFGVKVLRDSSDRDDHPTDINAIVNALSQIAERSRVNSPVDEGILLNAAFLVTQEREAEFDAKVKALACENPDLTFKYTGPWPPYNFVNAWPSRLDWEQ